MSAIKLEYQVFASVSTNVAILRDVTPCRLPVCQPAWSCHSSSRVMRNKSQYLVVTARSAVRLDVKSTSEEVSLTELIYSSSFGMNVQVVHLFGSL